MHNLQLSLEKGSFAGMFPWILWSFSVRPILWNSRWVLHLYEFQSGVRKFWITAYLLLHRPCAILGRNNHPEDYSAKNLKKLAKSTNFNLWNFRGFLFYRTSLDGAKIRSSRPEVFLIWKYAANLQENTHAEVWF